jgi:hydroxyacylglutathione hydrolase
MRVHIVPCLRDNYAYLVEGEGRQAVVVDPGEAEPVEKALAERSLSLVGVLCTHHHADHVGGVIALHARRGGLPVFGHTDELARRRIPGQTRGLGDGARFTVGGLAFTTYHVPGHTLGAVAYHVESAVFTGDTLFVASCGRLFEGTPSMYRTSLLRLAALTPESQFYVGHEYTLTNLRFALHVDPDNEAARAKLALAERARAAGQPTVPSSLEDELQTNPFLRAASLERFAELRRQKDGFQ